MSRRAVQGTVVLILLVVLVSGPIVPAVDLTTAPTAGPSPFCEPSGNASVTVVQPPNRTLTLNRQRFGAGLYRLPRAPTTVLVEDADGCPVLVYELSAPELGFFSRRLFWIENRTAHRVDMTLRRGRFKPETVAGERFNGTVRIGLRGDQNRTVYRANVTLRGEE